jgi:hypothetical protein
MEVTKQKNGKVYIHRLITAISGIYSFIHATVYLMVELLLDLVWVLLLIYKMLSTEL